MDFGELCPWNLTIIRYTSKYYDWNDEEPFKSQVLNEKFSYVTQKVTGQLAKTNKCQKRMRAYGIW